MTMPDGRTPLIGDDDGGRMLPLTTTEPDDFRGSLSLGAILFDRGDHKFVTRTAGQEIFWLTGADGLQAFLSLPAKEPGTWSKAFDEGGYFVMRDGWSDTDNFLAVDCGDIGSLSGGHGHADTLSIEVAIHGRSLLVDSGTYTYHESPELRDYFRSTSAHNTLTVDGLSSSEPGSAFSWRSRAEAIKSKWISNTRFDFFEGSQTGYERLGDNARHSRAILFVKGDYWIMRDSVNASGEHDYSLNFHYAVGAKPTVNPDGLFVGDEDHRLYTFGDDGIWEQKESWISNNHGKRMNAPLLRFNSRGIGPQEFFSFILPVDKGEEPPSVYEVPSDGGRAFVIKYRGYTDVLVYNDVPGESIDNGIFSSNFAYSWARLREGERIPDELILISGDKLNMNGKDLFEPHEVNSASILRLGQELYLKTDLGRMVKSL
jgi:hypothetical protein